MKDDLGRAYDFILRNDMAGSRVERMPWGLAVFAPEFPLRHDSNYVLVDPIPEDLDPRTLANEIERVQGDAGLLTCVAFFRDGIAAGPVVREMVDAGWTSSHGVVMALRRAPDRTLDLAPVVEADARDLRDAWIAQLCTYDWCTREIAEQLVEAPRALIPVPIRNLAVFDGTTPVSWGELRREGDVAQVEALATVASHRNRGLASRIVLRACAIAREEGARLVFLCADAEDWPQRLYRRLGFDEIGRYAKCTRTRAAARTT